MDSREHYQNFKSANEMYVKFTKSNSKHSKTNIFKNLSYIDLSYFKNAVLEIIM